MNRSIGSFAWLGAAVALLATPTWAQQPPQPLADMTFELVGLSLAVDPPALTVPKDTPTFIRARIALPDGAVAVTDAGSAVAELSAGAAVIAELHGPSLPPTTISALPGDPLNLPPLHLPGDYFLENIRLVKDGAVVLVGTPSTVPIKVISQVLVTSVTTRPLTLEEIKEKGIDIDASDFHVLNFQAAFVIDGAPVKIDFPVVLPNAPPLNLPRAGARGDVEPLAQRALALNQRRPQIALPPELDRPGLNLTLIGAEFVPIEPNTDEEDRTLDIPPIPALIVIPGNVGYLNEFFSAIVTVADGAPQGSGLNVRDITATIDLPKGLDGVLEPWDAPGDDPLRLAKVHGAIQPATIPVVMPGPDGVFGTSDDVTVLRPGESGQGEFLIEGLREGTHLFDIALNGTLEGLPSGPVKLRGAARGAVQVKNASFSLTLAHPRVVQSGEPYDLFATITNTSERTANLLSVRLDRRAVSGAVLLSDETVLFDTLAPGESATARFRLLSQRTGEITFSQITSDPGVTTNFKLTTGVGERGIPLAPNALVLPAQVDRLPDELVLASERVLGQAFSIATAPRLPKNVRLISRNIVFQRGRELAEAGMRRDFGEEAVRGLSDLALDWLGNASADPGFDQLLRTTDGGAAWMAALGDAFAAEIASGTVASPIELERRIAETVVARAGHISAVSSQGVARIRVTDAAGLTAGSDLSGTETRDIPFAEITPLSPSGVTQAALAIVGHLASRRYTIELFGTSDGSTDLGVVLPGPGGTDGDLLQASYSGLALHRGSHYQLVVDLDQPGDLSLSADANGDGSLSSRIAPSSVTAIYDRAPSVVAARSLTDLSETFHYNVATAHFGLLVDVLFNKPVDRASAESLSSYTIEGNAVLGAILEPTSRTATLFLERPIGALVSRTLTAQGIADAQGRVSLRQDVAIRDLLSDGAQLVGQVRRADGRPVSRAFVELDAWGELPPTPGFVRLAAFRTDENGYFDVDFVRKTLSPFFIVAATDPATGEQTSVQSRVRFVGGIEVANPIFTGRGRVTGRVLMPDGVTPAGICAVNMFPDILSSGNVPGGGGMYSSAQGTFAFEDEPVGNFSLSVERVQFLPDPRTGKLQPYATGEYGAATGTIRTSSATADVTVVLTSTPDARTGGVRGRVFLGDGITPAVGFPVFIGTLDAQAGNVSAVGHATTDGTGSFEVDGLAPTGEVNYDVVAVDPSSKEYASAQAAVHPDELAGVDVIFGASGAVTGIVRDASGNLVPNAIVSGGISLVSSDANGAFVIPDVPIGLRSIAAGDPVTRKTGSASVNVFPGQTASIEVRLRAAADIRGRVTSLGSPVGNAFVRIPIPGSGYYKAHADADGFYVFPNMDLGDYLVSAQGGGFPEPLSPDEVETKLNADIHDAVASNSEAAIRAAWKQAVEVFVGTSNLLFRTPPDVTPGNFGFTRVSSFLDGIDAVANIDFLPAGEVSGTTVDGAGLPTKAAMDVAAQKLDEYGMPVFRRLSFFESDAVTGAFTVTAIPLGNYTLEAARPFSPGIISHSGALTLASPRDDGIVMQFPPVQATSGTATGIVLLSDGVTPASTTITVSVSFGLNPLTVSTGPDGKFASPVPIPAGTYTFTALDPLSTLTGRSTATIPAGGSAFVPIRLLGRTAVQVLVLRPDGSPVTAAAVTVENGGFTADKANGTTGPDGKVAFSSLTEGTYTVLASDPSSLSGRAGYEIRQADALAGVTVGATVVIRGYGTITGTFLGPDGVTAIPNGQISLYAGSTVVGVAMAVAVTDASGSFSFDRVPVGSFSVLALDPASRRSGQASGRLVNQGDVSRLFVVTTGLGRVNGRLLSADGLTAIQGASVSLRGTRVPGSFSGEFPRIPTAADGSFIFDGVPEGPFEVSAYDPVSGFTGGTTGAITGDNDIEAIEVRLAAYGSIRGSVTDAFGSPATNVSVALSGMSATASRATAVDAQGSFEFTYVPLGSYRLVAQRVDPLAQADGGVTITALTVPDQVALAPIALNGVGTAAIAVVDASGAPVPSADVSVSGHTRFGGSFHVFTAADGTVTVPGLPVGDFEVSAQSSTLRTGGAASGTIPSANAVVSIQVQLGAAGSITGRVVLPDANATPAPGAFVILTFSSQTSFGGTLEVKTSALGEFSFVNVPAGAFSIDISEPISGGLRKLRGSIASNGDVVAFGAVVLDLAPPRVASTDPQEGAVAVPSSKAIAITFTQAIDPATVRLDGSGSGNLTLVDGHGQKVAASASLSPDGLTLTITPSAPLASETVYQLVIQGGDAGIHDAAASRPMSDPFKLDFTSIDSDPPILLTQSPAAGASGVLPDAVLRIAFSEAIAPGASLTLAQNGASVQGSTSSILGATVLVFTPAAPLATDTTYTYTLSGVTDIAGNALAGGDVTASFSTIRTHGPTVVSLALDGSPSLRAGTTARIVPSISDPETASIEFDVDDVPSSVVTSAPYGFELALPKGRAQVRVSAIATDTSGNRGPAASLVIPITPAGPPQVTLASSSAVSALGQGDQVGFDASASADAGIAQILFSGVGATSLSFVRDISGAPSATVAHFDVTIPQDAASSGTLTLQAVAIDTAGVASTPAALSLPMRDASPPTVAFTSPVASTAVLSGASIDVVVSASDDLALASVSLSASTAIQGTGVRTIAGAKGDVETFTIAIPSNALPGTILFTALAFDSAGNAASATRAIRVLAPQNQPPVAVDDVATTTRGVPVVIAVLANDSDPDGDSISLASVTQGVSGAVAMNADGTVTYTPSAGFTGSDPFTYVVSDTRGATASATVRVSVTLVNQRPRAQGSSFTTDQDTTLRVTAPGVLAGATDAEGETLSASLFSAPAHGTLALSPDGSFTFAPEAGYIGTITFQVLANDAAGSSDPATVTISVNRANAPPTAIAGRDRTAAVLDRVVLDGSASSDVDGDSLTYAWSFAARPASSTAVISDASAVRPSFVVDVPGDYAVQLVVNDGHADSAPATMTVSTSHVRPIADAGRDRTIAMGATATLDGARSSDSSGAALTYAWSFASRPQGSTAALSDASAMRPTFTADVAGDYVLSLVVSDGSLSSQPSLVTLSTLNSRPLAHAGRDRSAQVGDTVSLDGSGSLDADGDPLTFRWSLLSKPSGSQAALSSASAPAPSLAIDQRGTYVAQLIVNDGKSDSAPATVVVSTDAVRPAATPGPDTTAAVGASVALDGSGSFDPAGLGLSFAWSLLSKPAGSAAVISTATAVVPRMTVDVPGTYVAQLVVGNGTFASDARTVVISTASSPPQANPGPDQVVAAGSTVSLDGSGSTDADGNALSYRWTIVSKPSGSAAALTDPIAVQPAFTADVAGTYAVQLIVADANGVSEPRTLIVSTSAARPLAAAGSDQRAAIGSTVALDGSTSRSASPQVNALAYRWSLAARPPASAAAIANANAAQASFAVDQGGTYVAELRVSDGSFESLPAMVVISTNDARPAAVPGASQSVPHGSLVTLDGSGSTDADGDALAYRWALVARPAGSTAALSNATAVAPSFTADLAGLYVAQVIVSDGTRDSAPRTTTVLATTQGILTLSPTSSSLRAGTSETLVVQSGTPAPQGGIAVLISSDAPAVASVPSGVAIPAGLTSASFTVAAASQGTAHVTAQATGFASGTAAVAVGVSNSITLALDGPLTGVGRTIGGTITLASPAGKGGLAVTLSSGDVTIATIAPSSVTIAEGQTTATFSVSGLALGTTAINGSASGVAPVSVSIGVTSSVITLASGLVVGPGQSAGLHVSLSAPAPSAGLTIALSSADTTIATVASSASVSGGATAPSSDPLVSGVRPGVVLITASAPGFAPDTKSVVVTLTLAFAQPSLSVVAGISGTIGLTSSVPAPAGGLSISLALDSSAIASVPAVALIPAGQTSVPGGIAVTGIAAGSTVLRASAPGVSTVTAAVNVTPAPPITLVGATVGQNLEATLYGSLGQAAPAGNLAVTISSMEPSRLLLSTAASASGTASITVMVGAGSTSIPSFTVQALDQAGTVEVLASAPGYASGMSTITLAPSGFIINNTGSFTTTTYAGDTQIQITSSRLDPATLNYNGNQSLRGGFSVAVPFLSSSPATGTITVSPVTIAGGTGSSYTAFHPLSAGTSVLSAGVPSGFSTPGNDVSVTATVRLPNVNVQSSITVGRDLEASVSIYLENAPPQPVDLVVTCASGAVATLSQNGALEGGTSVTFPGVTSTYAGSVFVQGRALGTTTLSVSAQGYTGASSAVTVNPSGFIVNYPGDFTTTTFAPDTSIQITSAKLDPATLNWNGNQSLRGGLTVSVTVTSSNPSVGTITTSPVTLGPGVGSATTNFHPLSGGTTVVSVVTPGGFSAPSNYVSFTATVTAPTINIASSVTTGLDLETTLGIYLQNAPPQPVDVVVTSGSGAVATLSQDGALEGAATTTFRGVTGTYAGTIYVQGRALGTTTISVSAQGYSGAISTVTVSPSGFIVNSPGDFTTTTYAGDTQIQITSCRLDPATLKYAQNQTLRGGLTVSVPVLSSNPLTGTMTASPVTLGPGTSSAYTTFHPLANGTSVLSVGSAAGFSTPSNDTSVVASVRAPMITFSGSVTVGKDLETTLTIYLENAPPAPVDVVVTSASGAVATVVIDPTLEGSAALTIGGVKSTYAGTIYVQGRALGSTSISASAQGYTGASTTVTVNPSGFIINNITGSYTTSLSAADTSIQITSCRLDPVTLNYAGNQSLRGGLTVSTLSVTSSNPTVGTITASPVSIGPGASSVSTAFHPLSVGTSTVSVGTPAGFSAPSNDTSIVVTVGP